ncbi:peptidoglycan/xylan/chitin deacetylase (PgdA/CDA1 family) [Thermocatellispora tengchongensis]|uniref:Peptidoglycan/xylan/chitin deacetylase (PgdA/CDA1 family) n=1 Tax=Thermocatellispora tengchongensis TaxID=1073253 RepID=A0A840P4S8_9ACTN|nr:polysaccharide deacetylase family protein [Thermocatellispora tengchongensis]MBB5132490.1 peptidoglycan/xylan/chitin deacetylase (PgdA/CDA1 family) [Thermocatellispora tengchongensis]
MRGTRVRSAAMVLAAALALTSCGDAGAPPVDLTPPALGIEGRALAVALSAQQTDGVGTRSPSAGFRPRAIDCSRLKCVALTFDDGPGEYTGRLLDALAAYRAKATFFLVGQMVTRERVGDVLRMVAEGHELGNHSWDHALLPALPPSRIDAELARTMRVVYAATGVRVRLMRPPYGSTDRRVARITRREGLAQILWNHDTFDWRDRDPELIARRAVRARPGSIVLMHDIHKTTVQAVPHILARLHERGFVFVTVSELFGRHQPAPGRRYSQR